MGPDRGYQWWAHFKNTIRFSAAASSKQLNQDRLAKQTAQESIERAIKLGDSREIASARVELASLLIKKDEALVVRARLKRIYSKATN